MTNKPQHLASKLHSLLRPERGHGQTPTLGCTTKDRDQNRLPDVRAGALDHDGFHYEHFFKLITVYVGYVLLPVYQRCDGVLHGRCDDTPFAFALDVR